MKTILSAAAILAASLALFAASTAEEVDFSLPPKAGLKTKVTVTSSGTSTQKLSMGEREIEMATENATKQIHTQTLVEIKDGKIMKLERNYEDHAMTMTLTRDGDESDPREQESALAWKHVRVSWNDEDEASVTVKEDDEWTEPEGKLKRAIRAKAWRRGPLPLPKEPKKVGDTWEISGDEARKLFPISRGRPGRDSEDEEADPPEVTAKFEFVSIGTQREMKCAVLKLNLTIEGENMKRSSEMTFHYSLDHHIVVGAAGTTKSTMSMERESERGSFSMEMSGTNKQKVVVEIVTPDAEG